MPYSTHAIKTLTTTCFREGEHQIRSETKTRINNALQAYIATIADRAWSRASDANRKTLHSRDVDIEQPPDRDSLHLPIAHTRAQLEQTLPEEARLSEPFVSAVATLVEEHAETIVICSEQLMLHADRNSLAPEDINLYFSLFEDLPQ